MEGAMFFHLDDGDWVFPLSNGLANRGVNEGASDSFKGKPLEYLIRESCQNSLDAHASGNKPVIVAFNPFSLKKKSIPGIGDLEEHIRSCIKISRIKNNQNLTDVYSQMEKLLCKDEILCLRISDFNTTGLRGSREDENPACNSQWYNCVRSTGSSGGKPEDSAGSQGLGKTTAFLNSILRTVFYSTLDVEEHKAYEGISNLISHGTKKSYTGPGYYSTTQNKQPCRAIYKLLNLDPSFERKEAGTDVFIIGFADEDIVNNKAAFSLFVKAVVSDIFLPALKDNQLQVHIGVDVISADNLENILNELSDSSLPDRKLETRAHHLLEFNEVMNSTAEEYIFKTDSSGIEGEFVLKLQCNEGLCKRVVCYREVGMKICEKRKVVPFDFTAVLTIRGKELNNFMKHMENASHEKWEANAYVDKNSKKIASKLLRQLDEFIDEILHKASSLQEEESMDSGLGDILPDISEQNDKDSPLGVGLLKLDCSQVTDFTDDKTVSDHDSLRKKGRNGHTKIEEDPDGDIAESAFRETVHLVKKRCNTDTTDEIDSDDISENSGLDEILSKYSLIEIKESQVNLFPSGDGSDGLRLKIVPPKGAKKAMVKLNIAAESGEFGCNIKSASNEGGQLQIKDSCIMGVKLNKRAENYINVVLHNNQFKSYKVSVYAYQEK